MNIQSIGTTSILNNTNLKKQETNTDSELNFSKVMKAAINKVNGLQVDADQRVEALVKGEEVSMHDVMLTMQEAQLSMQLLIETRNKVVEAYQEVNRVQL